MKGNRMKHIAVQRFAAITDPNSGNEPERIVVHLLGDIAVSEFRNILKRALNCAPPHLPEYKDWYKLADLFEKLQQTK